MVLVCHHDDKKEVTGPAATITLYNNAINQGTEMNKREMTPRERQIEALKNAMLAMSVSFGFAWLLVDALTK